MPNKKSQLEDLFPLLVLIVFLLFAFIFSSCTNQIKSSQINEDTSFQKIKEKSSQLLFIFLKTPIDLDNFENSDIADALNLYFLTDDEDIWDQVQDKASEFYSASDLETEDTFWSLQITPPGTDDLDDILVIISSNPRSYGSKILTAKATIPTNNPDEAIEIDSFIFYT